MNSRTERSMCGMVICEIFQGVDDENASADKINICSTLSM